MKLSIVPDETNDKQLVLMSDEPFSPELVKLANERITDCKADVSGKIILKGFPDSIGADEPAKIEEFLEASHSEIEAGKKRVSENHRGFLERLAKKFGMPIKGADAT